MAHPDDAEHALFEELKAGRLQLPALPDIAFRVARAVRDEKRRLGDVARIVQADVAVTGRLIQIANSPLYRGVTPVANCQAAITRLGLKVTRNLVMSFAMRRLYQSPSRWLKARLQSLWLESSQIAAVSAVLGRITLGLDTDRALLAGLIHNVGALPALLFLDRHAEYRFSDEDLDGFLARVEIPLGAEVLRQWQFDEELVKVVLECHDWLRDAGTKPDYCDVVIVAKIHSLFGSSAGSVPRIDEIPAFGKFSVFKLGPSSSIELLHEAEQDIQEIKRLLSA